MIPKIGKEKSVRLKQLQTLREEMQTLTTFILVQALALKNWSFTLFLVEDFFEISSF